jgi:glycosyltransferase involved in cell wall biosynthesis
VIEEGVTGYVVDDVDAAVAATRAACDLDRRRCRERFEARFTAERMARDYVAVYERLVVARSALPRTELRHG